MKLKKILSLLIAVVMLFSLGVTAMAEETAVAKIGNASYTTFDEALTVASTMSGDVTVEIYDKVTLNEKLSGSYSSIKFVGKDTDAEIYLDVTGYITATGKKVAFENLILSKANTGGFITNAGFMNVAFGVYDVSEVAYTECTFANGAYASSGKVTYTKCTFKRSHDKYGLWAYGNVDVVVDGCTFADYRGIKMYAEGAAKTVDLTVKNTSFSAVTDKPAIVLTYGESVTLENNTYSSTGVFELDLDGDPNGTPVTSDKPAEITCKNDKDACGVLVDGKIYTTVAQAAAVATEGSTITLLHNSTETVKLPEGVILNTNNYTAENVTVASKVAYIGEQGYETVQAAINAAQKGDIVTIKEGTYAVPSLKAGITVVGEGDVLLEGTLSGTLEDLTLKNLHIKGGNAQRWAYAKGDCVFDNVTFEATSVYALHFDGITAGTNLLYKDCTIIGWAALGGSPASCVFEGCTIKGNGSYGVIRTYFATEIKNCTFDVDNVNSTDIYQDGIHAVDAKVDVKNCKNINGDMKDILNISGDAYVYVDGALVLAPAVPVAKIGETTYTTLAEALNAAASGTGNVTVDIIADIDLSDVDWNPVTVSAPGYPVVTVNGNNKIITGLNNMLFAGTWAGNSGLIINDLTIADSNIVNDENDINLTVGVGAFIGYPQASETITLNNCHLVNSTVKGGHWTGGLVGMAGGYNGNDGPVFMNLTIKDCSVKDSTITGKGSAGGVIGHGSCAAWTNVVIENTTVSGNTITSTGSSANKAGAVMGTIGAAGQPTTANGETKTGGASVSATVSNNTVTSNGTAITTIYGRQGTSTGMLYVAGGNYDKYPIEETVAYAQPKEGFEIVQNTDGTYGVKEKAPALPTAIVGDVPEEKLADAPNLTFSKRFEAADPTDEQKKYYGNWFADFELTVNKDVTFNADSATSDGYLAGSYDWYQNGAWISVPFEDVKLEAGQTVKIMSYAMELMGNPGLKLIYNDVLMLVKTFDCGVFFTDEFLAKNPDLEVTLELRMYNPDNESESYVIGEAYKFEAPEVEEEPTMDTEASFVRNIKTTNSAGEERYQVILFAGVDSLKYDSVGFEIIVNGETRTQTTKKVYTSYTAAGIKYTPKAWGENCNYIVSLPINFKPEMKNDSVTFRPFAVTLNGETLWGPEETIDKVYNK